MSMTNPECEEALKLLRECPVITEACLVFEPTALLINGNQVAALIGTPLFGEQLLRFYTVAEVERFVQTQEAA